MYDIARELGVWDVHGMMDSMSWDQLLEWIEYRKQNPFSEERDQKDDLRAGIITANIVNALLTVRHATYQSQSTKRIQPPKMYSPSDFIQDYKGRGQEKKQRQPLTSKTEFREFMSTMKEVYTT